MSPMPRRLPLPLNRLTLALATLPGLSYALGLGGLHGEAYLGEPLRVEIQLVGDSTPPLGRDCVSLQRPEQTPDDGSFPRNMTARIEPRAGSQVIVLSTPTSVAMPILEFRVALRCGFNVSREYSLLPLPKNDGTKAAAPDPVPAPAPTVPSPTSSKPATKPARAARIPDGIDSVTYNVAADMTLEQLADQHFHNQPMRRARFKRWVIEANPGLDASSRLSKGQEVAIPAGIPPRRPGDRQDPVTGEFLNATREDSPGKVTVPPKAPAAKLPATAETTAPASGGTQAASKDQLKIGGENKPPSFRNMKEAAQIIDRLNTLLEQQLAATVSAEDKLGKLETSVSDMEQRLGKAEANMAASELRQKAALKAAQDMLQAQEEHSQWLITIAGVGGLVLGTAITLALGLLRRKPKPATPFFVADTAAEATVSATPETVSQPPRASESAVQDAPAAASAFHRESEPEQVVHTVRPSLDFREALTSVTELPPQAATEAKPPPTPPTLPTAHLDFELDPEAHFELDPLDFTAKGEKPLPLPSVFESLNTTLPTSPTPLPALDGIENGTGVVELTNVMVSMGLAASAAESLAKHIAAHPRQSLQHWLKLLDVYRIQGSREAFEKAAEEMRAHFNVRAGTWEHTTDLPTRTSIEDFPHLLRNLQSTWREPGCVQYMHALLTDNREGTRSGFSQSVAEELLLLIAMLSEQT